jgi:penicillin amidase
MFQLELARRKASGTLSELFGASALESDRFHRTYGFTQVAESAAAALPAKEREEVEAYAAGINAFIDSHPYESGIEFHLLAARPRHWTVADSILTLLLLYEDLSESWRDEMEAEAIADLPPAVQRFMMPRTTDEDLLVVPDAEPKPRPDAPSLFSEAHAAWTPLRGEPVEIPGLPSWAGRREQGKGSNNWVIGPSRSKSGKPLLANDPHLTLTSPGIWYELRIELPSRWVQGGAIPGIPGIVIGQNDRIAWGFTALGADVEDVYREPAIGERVESIAVRGGDAVEVRVPLGKHGPQARPGYSVAWVALDPKNMRLPACEMMLATDWTSFNAAADEFYGPAHNVVYADVDGHIGWRALGLLPVRREGDDGLLPHDGSDPSQDWRGFVPMNEMPRVFDPPSGYIVTANQRVIGTSFPHFVTADWESPARARRIVERIEAAGKLDREGMESIQLDVVSDFHRELMKLVAKEVPSLDRFASWDGAATVDSTMFLEARTWEAGLIEVLRERVVGKRVEKFMWNDTDATLLAAMRADESAWLRAGLGDKKSFLRAAGERADTKLHRSSALTWGPRNALAIQHPIGAIGGPLAWIFNPPSAPQPGEYDTVRLSGPTLGQSFRMVVDWGDPGATTFVVPLGQSGHLGSAHRQDQREWWLAGDPLGAHTRLKQSATESLVLAP